MGLIAVDNGGGDFELPPAGQHKAICQGVIDLGSQRRMYEGVESFVQQVRIVWELPEIHMADNKPFSISTHYTLSLASKAFLRRDLESWRGRPFSVNELKGFDIFTVAGVSCLLNVSRSENNGKIYANVDSVHPLPQGVNLGGLVNPIVKFSLSDADVKVFNSLESWLQNKINVPPGTWNPEKGKVADAFEFPDDDIPF